MNFIQKIFQKGVIFIMLATPIISDEGMWTPDNLPLDLIKKNYQKIISPEFIKKIRLASVRFNDGGSGSFVSGNGLVLTNHHVALGQLQKLSTKKNDYVKNGYYATTMKRELKCPDLELNILVSLEDISNVLFEELKGAKSNEEISIIKKRVFSKLEKESFEKTGLRSNVVELYEGGEYWLYRYKKYTDIRLVFAPEYQAAAFGGDPDNFHFPRHDLDFTFFRVYENNKPIKQIHYLKWNSKGPSINELLFVSGHPGSTDRDKTLSQLKYLKEYYFPEVLKMISNKLEVLRNYSDTGKEEERIAKNDILGLENSYKALKGEYDSLNEKEFFEKIEEKENNLKLEYLKYKELQKEFGDIWESISKINQLKIDKHKEIFYTRISGSIPSYALSIIRYAIEIKKPNEERYKEYRDSSLDSWKLHYLSKAPVYKNKEKVIFRESLETSIKELGKDSKFIKTVLENTNVEDLIEFIIEKSNLDNADFREKLLKLAPDEILKSKDPAIVFMLKIEPIFREKRKWIEDEIETPLSQEGKKLAKLKFNVFGKSIYPDATFTLRLSYGKVLGYEVDGYKIPPFSTYHGLIDRSISMGGVKPYDLSPMIKKRLKIINLETPINFVSTHDITGGNSGSPVINTKGELVGLIFDGNTYSHSTNYIYSSNKARSVSVHSGGILESLKNIYKTKRLIKEIVGREKK